MLTANIGTPIVSSAPVVSSTGVISNIPLGSNIVHPVSFGYGLVTPLVSQPAFTVNPSGQVVFVNSLVNRLLLKPTISADNLKKIIKTIINERFDRLEKQVKNADKTDRTKRLRPLDELNRDLKKQLKKEINTLISLKINMKFKKEDKTKINKINQEMKQHFEQRLQKLFTMINKYYSSGPSLNPASS